DHRSPAGRDGGADRDDAGEWPSGDERDLRATCVSRECHEVMRRVGSVIGSTAFLLLAPGTVAGLVPWWIAGWRLAPPIGGMSWFRWFGAALIAVGVPLLLDSFARFALQGRGTPAPVLPTEHLVVTGLYRYVRNPMYVGVVTVVLGQGLV